MTPQEEKKSLRKKKWVFFFLVIFIEFAIFTLFFLIYSLLNVVLNLSPYLYLFFLVLLLPLSMWLTAILARSKLVDIIMQYVA